MEKTTVPIWAMLPAAAPESHRRAWERAWSRWFEGRRTRPATPQAMGAQIGILIGLLVEDPETPPEFAVGIVDAHLTEGRGAPDGIGPRARLLLAALRRDHWREAWLPAALVGLQEGEAELQPTDRIELSARLLRDARVPASQRPLVMALAMLGRPPRRDPDLGALVSAVLRAPDADPSSRAGLARLVHRSGWLVARPGADHGQDGLDDSVRGSLRRFREVRLLIPQRVVDAVAAELAALGDSRADESAALHLHVV